MRFSRPAAILLIRCRKHGRRGSAYQCTWPRHAMLRGREQRRCRRTLVNSRSAISRVAHPRRLHPGALHSHSLESLFHAVPLAGPPPRRPFARLRPKRLTRSSSNSAFGRASEKLDHSKAGRARRFASGVPGEGSGWQFRATCRSRGTSLHDSPSPIATLLTGA